MVFGDSKRNTFYKSNTISGRLKDEILILGRLKNGTLVNLGWYMETGVVGLVNGRIVKLM